MRALTAVILTAALALGACGGDDHKKVQIGYKDFTEQRILVSIASHLLRDAGAREVHLRISCPPTRWPCHYGIDTPQRKELIASSHSVEEIREFIGADTLGYLSHEGLMASVGDERSRYCSACFSGDYPLPIPKEGRDQLKLFAKSRD